MRIHPEGHASMKSREPLMKTGGTQDAPSRLIDARIEELGDWRGAMLARIRALIKAAVALNTARRA